jgi:hypothetical protein
VSVLHPKKIRFLKLLQSGSFESSVRKEQEEHPQLSMSEAREITMQHLDGDILNPTRFEKGSEEAKEFMRRLRAVKANKAKK